MPYKADHHDWGTFLTRRPIEGDAARVQAAHEGKTILLTGAGGSIGGELAAGARSSATWNISISTAVLTCPKIRFVKSSPKRAQPGRWIIWGLDDRPNQCDRAN